jgi:hypothetical protein
MIRILFLAAAVLSSTVIGSAQTLIAGWDFQTTTNGGTAVAAAPSTPTTLLANFGTQAGTAAIYANGTNGSSTFTTATSGNEITAFGGSGTVNIGTGFSTTTTTGALAIVYQAASSTNGKGITFKLSMTGYENLAISYATQKTSTGFSSNQWSYSTDGTNFTNFGSAVNPATSFASVTLSGVLSSVNNASSVWIKYTFGGATTSSGNNRLDNIQFTATAIPEPSTYAAMAGVAALLGVMFHRRRQQQAAKV